MHNTFHINIVMCDSAVHYLLLLIMIIVHLFHHDMIISWYVQYSLWLITMAFISLLSKIMRLLFKAIIWGWSLLQKYKTYMRVATILSEEVVVSIIWTFWWKVFKTLPTICTDKIMDLKMWAMYVISLLHIQLRTYVIGFAKAILNCRFCTVFQ